MIRLLFIIIVSIKLILYDFTNTKIRIPGIGNEFLYTFKYDKRLNE